MRELNVYICREQLLFKMYNKLRALYINNGWKNIGKLFDRFTFLYSIYRKTGLKDIRNRTRKLMKKLRKDNYIANFEGFKMILDEHSYMDLSLYKELLKHSSYEADLTKYIRDNLRPGNSFVDIGANSGYYTLLASSIVGANGVVISFEPHPGTYNRLLQNVKLNSADNVKLYNIALSSYDGKGKLNVSRSSDGLNSLKPILLTEESIDVDIKRLDTIIGSKSVNMIKIDAEGSELDILEGAKLSLMKNPRVQIIYEINRTFIESTNVIKKLNDLGFSSFVVKNGIISVKISSFEDIPIGIDNLIALRNIVE